MKNHLRKTIYEICRKDRRYPPEAYYLVFHGFLRAKKNKDSSTNKCHQSFFLSAKEVLEGFLDIATEKYGPITECVLYDKGIVCSEDIGEIVHHMIAKGIVSETRETSNSKFDLSSDYDFDPNCAQIYCWPEEEKEAQDTFYHQPSGLELLYA